MSGHENRNFKVGDVVICVYCGYHDGHPDNIMAYNNTEGTIDKVTQFMGQNYFVVNIGRGPGKGLLLTPCCLRKKKPPTEPLSKLTFQQLLANLNQPKSLYDRACEIAACEEDN